MSPFDVNIGDGLECSTSMAACLIDDDCPSGQTCDLQNGGGASSEAALPNTFPMSPGDFATADGMFTEDIANCDTTGSSCTITNKTAPASSSSGFGGCTSETNELCLVAADCTVGTDMCDNPAPPAGSLTFRAGRHRRAD